MRKMLAPLCRHTLLQYAAGAAGGATIAMALNTAIAAPKVSKQAVAYQDHPDGEKRCEKCAQFQPPDACKMVWSSVVIGRWEATRNVPLGLYRQRRTRLMV